jgi:hypothetical protein
MIVDQVGPARRVLPRLGKIDQGPRRMMMVPGMHQRLCVADAVIHLSQSSAL